MTLACAVLSEDDQKELAQLMTHSEGTQKQHYAMLHKTPSNVRISVLARKLLLQQEVLEVDLQQAGCGNDDLEKLLCNDIDHTDFLS